MKVSCKTHLSVTIISLLALVGCSSEFDLNNSDDQNAIQEGSGIPRAVSNSIKKLTYRSQAFSQAYSGDFLITKDTLQCIVPTYETDSIKRLAVEVPATADLSETYRRLKQEPSATLRKGFAGPRCANSVANIMTHYMVVDNGDGAPYRVIFAAWQSATGAMWVGGVERREGDERPGIVDEPPNFVGYHMRARVAARADSIELGKLFQQYLIRRLE